MNVDPYLLRLRKLLPEVSQEVLTLAAREAIGGVEYLVLHSADEDAGSQFVVRLSPEGDAVLAADNVAFPLPTGADSAATVPYEVELSLARQLAGHELPSDAADAEEQMRSNLAALEGRAPAPIAFALSSNPPTDSGDLNQRLFREAQRQVGVLKSAQAPGTNGGNLACVWAVNQVYRTAFGRNLTGTLGTSVLAEELAAGKGTLIDPANLAPGDIVISPTGSGKGTGHVGIVGAGEGEDRHIYSNSSSAAEWRRNYTFGSWRRRFVEGKEMPMHFYRLSFAPFAAPVRSAASAAAGTPVRKQVPGIPEVATGSPEELSDEALSALARIEALNLERAALAENARRSVLAAAAGAAGPIRLVAMGDSWFDFSLPFHHDVIDVLSDRYGYEIQNVAKAGACVYELAYGTLDESFWSGVRSRPSQLEEIVGKIAEFRPQGILLSGSGNDFAGPEFIIFLHHLAARPNGVNEGVVDSVFRTDIEPAYRRMIEVLIGATRRAGLGRVPILVHGYDYAFPDGRSALNLGVKKVGPWLAPSMLAKGYPNESAADMAQRRGILRKVVDALYGMLARLAKAYPQVRVVDVRGTLPTLNLWHDELHPTDPGFELVAAKFASVLGDAGLVSSPLGVAPASAAAWPAGGDEEFEAARLHRKAEALAARAAVRRATNEGSPLSALRDLEATLAAAASDSTAGGLPTVDERETTAWKALEIKLFENLRWGRAAEETSMEAAPAGAAASAPSLPDLRAGYRTLWDSCTILPARTGEIAWVRSRLLRGRPRYEALATELRIPWFFVAAIHAMEAGGLRDPFTGHQHNGDPLTGRTVNVPAHRPPDGNPPFSWEASARDAHTMPGKQHHLQTDWSLEAVLFRLEAYNGFGYRRRGLHSPYLWSFSNHSPRGRYVRDGVFDPNAESRQVGAAVILKDLALRGILSL